MNKIEDKGLTIKVADVKINTEVLNIVNGNLLLESIVPHKVEGSSIQKTSQFIKLNKVTIQTNHFLLMLQTAFNEHKPICISPDDIWLLICHGFSEHIKLNSEYFKETISGLDEKQTIQVRRDDFVIGQDNSWEEIFPEFTKEITKKINTNLYSNIVLNFSTSTEKEINAFEISFMDSMSNYFDYDFVSMCGIPEIELRGTIEDYKKIIAALGELKKYKLGWWIDRIIPVITKIIGTLNGQVYNDFWNSLFKENNQSGGPFITGWISYFFPYLKTTVTEKNGIINYKKPGASKNQILKTIKVEGLNFDNYKIHTVQIRNPRLDEDTNFELALDDFPSGKSTVPFKWIYRHENFEMNFISGFIGIKENELSNTLSTDINWIVSRT